MIPFRHPIAQRLWALSDVRALHALHFEHPQVVTDAEWQAIVAHHRYALDGPDVYATAPSHTWGTRTMEDAEQEVRAQIACARWRLIEDGILSRIPPNTIHRALDFGTWVGAHAWALSVRFPQATVFARDIVPDLAPVVAAMSYGRDIVFDVGDYRELPNRLDLLFAGEVLEHIWDWEAAIEAFEQACHPGALIILTMPMGAWEADAPEHLHVMHWDVQSCRDVFGRKAGFRVTSLAYTTPDDYRGWNIVEFRAQSGPTGSVDYAARFKLWGLG